jgi:hypothetical protein
MTKEINEVSNVTLNTYAVKAKKEISDRQFGRKERDPAKMKKRASGVKQAKEKLAKSRAKLTKEDVQPLIIAAASGSAVDFTNVFEELITNKISDLVEAKKEEIASTLLGSTTTKVPATDK